MLIWLTESCVANISIERSSDSATYTFQLPDFFYATSSLDRATPHTTGLTLSLADQTSTSPTTTTTFVVVPIFDLRIYGIHNHKAIQVPTNTFVGGWSKD